MPLYIGPLLTTAGTITLGSALGSQLAKHVLRMKYLDKMLREKYPSWGRDRTAKYGYFYPADPGVRLQVDEFFRRFLTALGGHVTRRAIGPISFGAMSALAGYYTKKNALERGLKKKGYSLRRRRLLYSNYVR